MAYGPTGGLGLRGWTSPAPYWNWNWKLNCLVRPEKLLDPRRSRMMLCQASRSNFDLMWPWPLAFCIWAVLTQSALTIICACHVWLKFVRQFSRNLTKMDFFDISASCDPDLWPSDSQSWPFHAHSPWTTCTNSHQNRFICLQNIIFRNWWQTRSDFWKSGSVTMLLSLIRILHVSLVQIDTEMAEKYAKLYPKNNNQKYALSSHSEDIVQDVCQH